MNYKYIDMETYKRRSHFEYFKSLAYPYVGVTVNVDITELLKTIKEKHLPFFFTICYCVSRSANKISEFRQRILDNQIIEFDSCPTSHTVALEDETYCYCSLDKFNPGLGVCGCVQDGSGRDSTCHRDWPGIRFFFFHSLPLQAQRAVSVRFQGKKLSY